MVSRKPAQDANAEVADQQAAAKGLKDNAVNMSVYLLRDDHRRLRRLAVDEDTSMQTLMLDAIDLLFAQRGLPPVARWEPRRKSR